MRQVIKTQCIDNARFFCLLQYLIIYRFFQATLLWDDPKLKGWQHQTSYGFHITHRPSIGLIRSDFGIYQMDWLTWLALRCVLSRGVRVTLRPLLFTLWSCLLFQSSNKAGKEDFNGFWRHLQHGTDRWETGHVCVRSA